ncbi:uncharacterized protein BP01DRAFT_390630 [Aspergillus saccharolyticus JOP 1030-1]|uniref:Mediator of RNA polymerase II transcription subunit 4 n=1 Tax=Aspergillus saccharolyticus JOP 1030-1 TaxID=1450539 RepID=A0A318ZJJ2_9EURO|nr:hypothetical protein BP01DRAFT_390630 [Aspergillus saccharolyticus JOP 1030-1]PYH46975.1 hypothetical protein BP01DRAFT_390630 [Aspergillus saccharolyticus JOP 1030-1]
MNTQTQTALRTLESTLHTLLTTLTISPTASGAPTAALNLLAADDALTATIETLRVHQANYARILALRAEAQALEEKVKGVVREVVRFEEVIGGVIGDSDSDSDSEFEDDFEDDSEGEGDVDFAMRDEDTYAATEHRRTKKLRGVKEVDYKLLLDFARRISKYNHQAAADAAAGVEERIAAARRASANAAAAAAAAGTDTKDAEMGGMTGAEGGANGDSDQVPVAEVTKGATSWLDESAQLTRQVYMLPYPMEDRIRMGLMGQIQLAAAEGRPGFEVEGEVERLIREAEGLGVADPVAAPAVEVAEQARHADEAARAAALAGSTATSGGARAAAPPPKPKATLDLDLYDPDEDDE